MHNTCNSPFAADTDRPEKWHETPAHHGTSRLLASGKCAFP